jgi:hypothetical protein
VTPELRAAVEKVARAIREDWRARMSAEDRAETMPWEDIEAEERDDCLAMALAAIRAVAEATREATEAVLLAGERARDDNTEWLPSDEGSYEAPTDDQMKEVHRAMHAASILGEALRDE